MVDSWTACRNICTMTHVSRSPRWCLAPLVVLLSFLAVPAFAQDAPSPAGTLTVATREAPPFVMKGDDGEWHGLAIDLWRDIARQQNLQYRIVGTDLKGMVDGVADGRYDLSIGALTVTPQREQKVDFTHPFHTTGFGIVVGKAPPSWLLLLRNFFTWSFLQAVLALLALLAVIGLLFWLAERRHNEDEFGGGTVRGIASGMWFSAVTMTTVGYGDKAPRSWAGKALALIWMFGAIIIISTFTGMIASSLTEGRLTGRISGPDDLSGSTIGSIRGSAAEDWLHDRGLGFQDEGSIAAGLKAVRDGKIDAFVYDRPLLAYLFREGDAGKGLRMVQGTFGRQDYAFALPQQSSLREPLNRALLTEIDSQQWAAKLKQVLGKE
ncbi:transporter substrate-binding domain-containing protein [Stakelama sp. CBK3Z-3]|uniref:Transporter substrate-binding domain-containing protein n=1 Tax=Stakelama flava TaxID=2860338 RepID=A0ABS6XLZ0_9SPHN|nr:transporter substrate-binding domain-containing protein [Stakelama flava]MBW4330406.1 transporter substrate-binding domain-containing protein [Stakelama flava]